MATVNNEEAMDALVSLDEKAFLAYVVLIGKGPLTLDEVSLYLDQPIEDTRDSLGKLAEKGLVTALAQTVPAYFAAQPYHHLRNQLELVRSSEAKIRESIKISTQKMLDATGKEVTSLMDLVPVQEAQLKAALENLVSGDQKEFRKAQVESASSINGEIKTLRKDLDETIKEANTGFVANLSEIKTIMGDVAKDFGKDLATSTSRDIIEQNTKQLSSSIEAFKTLPSRLTETITKGCEKLTKQMAGFKSAAANLLAKFDRTGKTIQTALKTADSSLQTTMKQIKSILSEVEEDCTEAIRMEPGVRKKKLSAQAIFMDAQADIIDSLTKALDEVALAYPEAIKKAQRLADELISDIKAQVREFFKVTLDLTAADSRIAKQLDKRVESLENETAKITDALTQEMGTAIRKGDELAKIQANLVTTLQSLASNIQSTAAKMLRDYRESDGMAKIQKQTVEIENYCKQVLSVHDNFGADLSGSVAEIMGQLDRFEEKHNAALSITAMKLEGAIKDLRDKNIDVSDLSDLVESLLSENKDLGQLKEETKSKLDHMTAGIAESSKRSSTELLNVSQSIIIQLKEQTENLPGRIETLVHSVADEVESTIATTRKELEVRQAECGEFGDIVKIAETKTTKAIEKQLKSIEGSLEALKQETAKDVITRIQKIETDFDEAVKAFKGHLLEGATAVDNVAEAQRVKIKTLSKGTKEKLFESLRRTQEDLSASIGEATDLATKTIGETKKAISESASNMLSEIDSTVSAIGEKLTALMDENNEMIESQKTGCCVEIESACTQVTDKTMPEILEMMNLLKVALSKMETTLTEKTVSLITKISSISTELATNMSVQLSNLNGQAKTKSSKVILGSAENLSNRLVELASQQNSSMKEMLAESMRVNNSRLIQSLEKLKSSTTDEASAIVSAITPLADEVDKIAATNGKMLAKLGESIKELARVPAVEKTWHLLSKPTIIDHLRGMLDRARATVFIEVPTLSYLPTASELGKRKEVLFYIQVGETVKAKSESSSGKTSAQSKDDLESLKLLPNVRLITKQGSPYIVLNRDNAEILVGIENPGDVKLNATAIVSEEKAYINLVRDVIGPSLLSEPQN